MNPKYPDITIKLTGKNGNAFALLGEVRKQARGKIPEKEVKQFFDEAVSGNYDHLLQTCMKWFNII